MDLKDAIKRRLCRVGETYGGVDDFVHWARVIDRPLLLRLLNDIQAELDEQVLQAQSVVARTGGGRLHLQLYVQWCQRCTELREHYRTLHRTRSRTGHSASALKGRQR